MKTRRGTTSRGKAAAITAALVDQLLPLPPRHHHRRAELSNPKHKQDVGNRQVDDRNPDSSNKGYATYASDVARTVGVTTSNINVFSGRLGTFVHMVGVLERCGRRGLDGTSSLERAWVVPSLGPFRLSLRGPDAFDAGLPKTRATRRYSL